MAYNEIRTINNIQLEDIKARQSIQELDNKKANKSDVVSGLNFKGTTTYSALPTSDNSVGDFYYVTDGDGTNGDGNYAWNGTAWYFSGKTTDFGDISTKANTAVNNAAFEEGKLKVTKNDGTSTETEVIDSSLTKSGKAADAKATGDALNNLNIRPATSTTLGGVKVGSGLSVTDDGTLSADAQEYTLPVATATTLGGVKVGDGLTVDADGKLSADSALAAYPVGSIYQSADPTSPAALFGGSWEEIASDRVLMGASSAHAAGTTVEAGLPNINGKLKVPESRADDSPFRGSRGLSNFGALRYTVINASLTGYSEKPGYAYNIEFNASFSNSIYGRSETVQPAAYYVYIWRRVA